MIRKIHKIQGYNVDLMTFEEAIDFVLEKMKKKKGIQIVTVNPEMIELAHNNNQFSKILKNAELVIPDGVGIKWALKLQGIEQEQIPGIDFAKELINSCNVFGYTVAFIGAIFIMDFLQNKKKKK
jgi:N-acetylglucosaminyldiphosphoundecaprenol N-acetyl-beta-D-mannosaminyltransferase